MVVTSYDSSFTFTAVEDLENRGIGTVWMTSGSTGGGDSIGVFTAAALGTQNVAFGTAITQTLPRHPIAVGRHVITLTQLASASLRSALGTSGRRELEQTLGVRFGKPLAHLTEYVRIPNALPRKEHDGLLRAPLQCSHHHACRGRARDGRCVVGGPFRHVRGENRRRYQMGISGSLWAVCSSTSHGSRDRGGLPPHSSHNRPCVGLRP